MAMGSPGLAAGALAQCMGNVGHPHATGRLIVKGTAAQWIPPPDCPHPNVGQFRLDHLECHDNMRGAQGESELGGLENGSGAPRLAPGSAPAALAALAAAFGAAAAPFFTRARLGRHASVGWESAPPAPGGLWQFLPRRPAQILRGSALPLQPKTGH